jgi:hypothetical protein
VFLPDFEVRPCIDRVSAAFPRFADWRYVNEKDRDHDGFAVWGRFELEPEESMGRDYFITFDTYKTMWVGHLSIGKHCYYWSSADFGDANLVDTGRCATLDEAIASLRSRIADLFAACSGAAG